MLNTTARGNISITFRPAGIKTLVAELDDREENAARTRASRLTVASASGMAGAADRSCVEGIC